MKTKILLFENQRLYLENLLKLIEGNDHDHKYSPVAIYDFDEIEKNISLPKTILFLNTGGIPAVDVPEYIEKLLFINSELKIIVHSNFSDAKLIKRFFDKGIKSYLSNSASGEELLEALECVSLGKIYINRDSQNLLLNYICNVDDPQDVNSQAMEELTAREKDVLELICDGLRSKEIAEKLFISTHTVESHRRSMMAKFNLNNSSKLVHFAFKNNLVSL